MEVIPQEQVQERGLAVGVVAQRGRAEPGVQEAEGRDKESGRREENRGIKFRDKPPTGAIPPPDHIQFVQEFIDAGVVIVTLGHHQVQGPAVLGADLLHQVIGHFLSLREGKGHQSRGTDARRGRDHLGRGAEPGAATKHCWDEGAAWGRGRQCPGSRSTAGAVQGSHLRVPLAVHQVDDEQQLQVGLHLWQERG